MPSGLQRSAVHGPPTNHASPRATTCTTFARAFSSRSHLRRLPPLHIVIPARRSSTLPPATSSLRLASFALPSSSAARTFPAIAPPPGKRRRVPAEESDFRVVSCVNHMDILASRNRVCARVGMCVCVVLQSLWINSPENFTTDSERTRNRIVLSV